jgi:hypothetical protein
MMTACLMTIMPQKPMFWFGSIIMILIELSQNISFWLGLVKEVQV